MTSGNNHGKKDYSWLTNPIKTLGIGASSTVSLVENPESRTKYVCKCFGEGDQAFTTDGENENKAAAEREREALSICKHNNIVKFYLCKRLKNCYYFLLEYCEGGDLLTVVTNRKSVPLEACRYTIAELFSAVFYLHTGEKSRRGKLKILHRDIKPENIMLTGDFHVRLIDFGASKTFDGENCSISGKQEKANTMCGTYRYMAPELLSDNYTCEASDYWGCGCVLYFLLTGRRPFERNTPHAEAYAITSDEPIFPPSVDPEGADLIRMLLAKKVDERITMDGVRSHPFFSTVDFDTLHTVDLKGLWMQETPWTDELHVTQCTQCSRESNSTELFQYCRDCGHLFCEDCLALSQSSSDRYNNISQRVCKGCNDFFSQK